MRLRRVRGLAVGHKAAARGARPRELRGSRYVRSLATFASRPVEWRNKTASDGSHQVVACSTWRRGGRRSETIKASIGSWRQSSIRRPIVLFAAKGGEGETELERRRTFGSEHKMGTFLCARGAQPPRVKGADMAESAFPLSWRVGIPGALPSGARPRLAPAEAEANRRPKRRMHISISHRTAWRQRRVLLHSSLPAPLLAARRSPLGPRDYRLRASSVRAQLVQFNDRQLPLVARFSHAKGRHLGQESNNRPRTTGNAECSPAREGPTPARAQLFAD